MLDKIHQDAQKVIEDIAEFEYLQFYGLNENVYSAVYTQLTPIKTNLPVFCPCTSVEHIKAPKVIHLDDEWKATEGKKITSTAEHTWSLILQLAKKARLQLKDKMIGIIGYGRLGKMIGKYADAFGMTIYDIDRKQEKSYGMFYHDYYEYILGNSDVITINIPLKGNEGMFGKADFELMKPGALLVNTSRQGVIKVDELIPFIENEYIYYADDFLNDVEIPGAIQTPHVGGNSKDARRLTDIYIAEQMRKYLEGLCLANMN